MKIQPSDARRYLLPRFVLDDKKLSFGARGLLAWLWTRPNDYEIEVEAVVEESPLGRDGVYALLRELKEAHFLQMSRNRHGGVEYALVIPT